MIRDAIIIEGERFDWEAGEEHMKNSVSEDGQVNWGHAFRADPGVTSCPVCKKYYWREGEVIECPECGTQWRHTNR